MFAVRVQFRDARKGVPLSEMLGSQGLMKAFAKLMAGDPKRHDGHERSPESSVQSYRYRPRGDALGRRQSAARVVRHSCSEPRLRGFSMRLFLGV